jgi:hypothetical protein
MNPETEQFPDAPADEPILNTAGYRSFRWYSNWQQELLCCSRCGWVGNATIHHLEDADAFGAIIQCPNCQRRMGEVLFPNLKDTEAAAAQGNAEAQLRLPELLRELRHAENRILRFEQQKILSVDQIPELAGDNLDFIWDFAEIDGEDYQIIQMGNVEIWREQAFFENIHRFNEVKELLRRKYGPRFKALTPSRESLEWLCGDNAGKLFQLSYT